MASPVSKARRASMGSPGSNTGTGDSNLAAAAAMRLASRTNTPASTPAPVRATNRVGDAGTAMDKSAKAPTARPGVTMPAPVGKDVKTRLQSAARRRIKKTTVGY